MGCREGRWSEQGLRHRRHRRAGGRRHLHRVPGRHLHRHHGSVGFGQVHADALHRRAGHVDVGPGVHRRHRSVDHGSASVAGPHRREPGLVALRRWPLHLGGHRRIPTRLRLGWRRRALLLRAFRHGVPLGSSPTRKTVGRSRWDRAPRRPSGTRRRTWVAVPSGTSLMSRRPWRAWPCHMVEHAVRVGSSQLHGRDPTAGLRPHRNDFPGSAGHPIAPPATPPRRPLSRTAPAAQPHRWPLRREGRGCPVRRTPARARR